MVMPNEERERRVRQLLQDADFQEAYVKDRLVRRPGFVLRTWWGMGNSITLEYLTPNSVDDAEQRHMHAAYVRTLRPLLSYVKWIEDHRVMACNLTSAHVHVAF